MAIFMDLETYEQYEVPTALIEERIKIFTRKYGSKNSILW